MRIDGKKKHVKRAVFAACLLDVYDFHLTIVEGDDDNSGLVRTGERSFLMDLECGLKGRALTRVIAHEMTHLAQYMHGYLGDTEDGHIIWRGETYDEPLFGSDEYFHAPWERDARATEEWIRYRWETRSELH